MGRTSIKNQLILNFMALLLIIMAVVGIVNHFSRDIWLAQAVSTAFALAAGIIFGGIFSGSIVTRLNRLSDAAREISRGDLSRNIAVRSQDEVRDLEEIFDQMVNDLRDMIGEMKHGANQISRTYFRLSRSVRQVLEHSEGIDQLARSIADSSEKQSHIVQQTSASLDKGIGEMEALLQQSSATVFKINEARAQTELGEASARQTMMHLERMLKQMVEYTKPMYRLARNVEKMKLIINVMDEIAQKTDLLSLNASIEATRAGESGRGFALVADEIRNMAINSKNSSQEIRRMIETVLDDNQAVTEALGQTQEGINDGRETIHGIADTLSAMLSGVKGIAGEVEANQSVLNTLMSQMRNLIGEFEDLSQLAAANYRATRQTTVATRKQKVDMTRIIHAMQTLKTLSEKILDTHQRFKLSEERDPLIEALEQSGVASTAREASSASASAVDTVP
jgi:methyl-accepting chemotaxis protein